MASRTLLQLTDELAARGYDYLPTSRRRQFVNDALAELSESFPWPFLEGSYTGIVPVNMGTVAGVNYARSVQSVNDVTSGKSLPFIERTVLAKQGVNFGLTGTPDVWYWQGTQLRTYPATTGNVVVEFLGATKELTADTDTLEAPMQFHALIIDGAVIRALQDDDNYTEVQAARLDWDRRYGQLVASYAGRQVEPRFIMVTDNDWNS
jgi:hypothetical protein